MALRASRARVLGPLLLIWIFPGALPETSGPDPVPALRAAREAHEAGELAKALRELGKLERGPLGDHASLLRAEWLHEAGDAEAALLATDAALSHDPPSELQSRIHAVRARIYLAGDILTAAYRAQQLAWESTRDPDRAGQLAYELARIFEERGLPGDALSFYREVWQSWPRSSVSAEAYERSIFLESATGATAPTPEALNRYADGLRARYRCEGGLEVYERVLARDPLARRERRRSERGRADCLFQTRRYDQAQQAYAALAKSDPKDVDAAIRAARAHARAGRVKPAVRALTAVSRRSEPAEQARARYLIAVIASEEDPRSSRRLFERVAKQKDAEGLARLARWRLAWGDLSDQRWESARRRLRPLTRGPLSDIEVQRARYWSAVATLEVDRDEGHAELRVLSERVPLSYYGLAAADRLNLPFEVERTVLNGEARAGPFAPARRATWLLEAGFRDNARAELASWLRAGRLTRSERVVAASLLHGLGDHFDAVRLLVDGFGGALEEGIDPDWREAWQHAWPQPFELAVRDAASEFEFDPALVYAVMREESTYRPEVESPAGALGLMQIIPPTADRIASSLGMNAFQTERLLEPDTNIRFGTYYLKHLMGLFDGSPPLAIAAYNAGPDVVTSWVSREGPLPQDAFVDSVPYSETRRYLRKVLRSWRVYRLLYESSLAASERTAPQPPEAGGR